MSNYIVIGSNNCAYCSNALALLDQRQLPFNYKNINEVSSLEIAEFEKIAGATGGFRTVPQIFKTNSDNVLEYIGGYSDLAQTFRSKS